jgi:hypothetical protein
MSSLSSIVRSGPLQYGAAGEDVKVLQTALGQAGYRLSVDGEFGPNTQTAVRRFQMQHQLTVDGIVGAKTAAFLDLPHDDLVATAKPMATGVSSTAKSGDVAVTIWPHDDTASMTNFYGRPWERPSLLVPVTPPWQMFYTDERGTRPVHTFQMHQKCASAVALALSRIWDHYKTQEAINAVGLQNFGGSYNYRPIRGSSRLSCHAFGAALDLDPVANPMIYPGHPNVFKMPKPAVDSFKSTGAFWGDDYHGRKDPMHFQYANEG